MKKRGKTFWFVHSSKLKIVKRDVGDEVLITDKMLLDRTDKNIVVDEITKFSISQGYTHVVIDDVEVVVIFSMKNPILRVYTFINDRLVELMVKEVKERK